MNRRTFLKTTGAVATTPLLSELVSGASETADVQHLVLVMMENRSFDHLLGWLPNANGIQAGLQFPNKTGGYSSTHELAPDFTGCAYTVPDHSYSGGRVEVDH
jgi:phospholipase C